MTQTGTVMRFDRKQTCDDCGANADVLIEADVPQQADGYRDALRLCQACFAARNGNK